ncbi:MAG TPA: tetratricopeptide repeat protein [Syntrophales bacterium]|nr:tetratricopeptide repeat protein [Syntrophales bacterium]
MAEKLKKKELKQPDRFQIFLASLLQFFLAHKKKVVAGAVFLVVLILAISGWWYYQYDQETKAFALYQKVSDSHRQALREKKDLSQIVSSYRDIVNRFPYTRSAQYALLRLGNLYLREGKIEEAISFFKQYVEKNRADNELLVIAYNALGTCYEEKGDFRLALEAYEKASRLKAGAMFESINYGNLARVYEALKDKKKAAEYYEKAKAKAVDPVLKDWYARKSHLE